jgi:hypothetical protein
MADFSQDEIAARAHQIWRQRGCPTGQEAEHWALAREQIANEALESARNVLPERPIEPERELNLGGTS